MNNYAESLFDAIKIIAEERIANLNYDKTLICTITNIADEKNDIYVVSDGSISFKARGDGNKYKIDDQVRVLILNGDYSKEKFIQGKYKKDDDIAPITYVSPLESVLDMTENLSKTTGEFGIVADGMGIQKEILLETFNFDDEIYDNEIFNTLFLSAEFKNTFDQYDMRSGDYGLHLVLGIVNSDNTVGRKDLYFSALRDMIGNPYAFKIYTKQEIKYELSSWPSGVRAAWLYLYQDGQFTYYNHSKQVEESLQPITIEETIINNIQVQNICIGFGTEITKIEDNQITLYTTDSLQFDHMADANELSINKKHLDLLWYNKTSENKYIGFSDGVVDLNSDGIIKDYDESIYLEKIAKNNRLIMQIREGFPQDENSLDLLADVTEIQEQAKNAYKLIGEDLAASLRGFKEHIRNIKNLPNTIDSLLGLTEEEKTIGWYANEVNAASQFLSKKYTEILQSANELHYYLNEEYSIAILHKYHNNITDLIRNPQKTGICDLIELILSQVEEKIKNGYDGYESIYSSYQIRLLKFINQLDNCNNLIQSIYNDTNYFNKTNSERLYDLAIGNTLIQENYIDKKNEYANSYDNRYCVYWYRYLPGYIETNKPFLPEGWQYIDNSMNIGLPSTYIYNEEDKKYYFEKRAKITDPKRNLIVNLQQPIKEERFKVVLFYNHNQFESQELIFTNKTEIIDGTIIDINGALSIEHTDTSQASYQAYDANGYLVNSADHQKKHNLRVRFSGITGSDEQLIGATVYWYIPKQSTMLEVFNSDLDDKWHTDRIDSFKTKKMLDDATGRIAKTNRYYLVEADNKIYEYKVDQWVATDFNPSDLKEASIYKEGYDCYYRQIAAKKDENGNNIYDEYNNLVLNEQDTLFPYHISQYYISTATQNGIYCKVIKNNQIYYAETFISFSSYGNSGTSYTLALLPDNSYPMYIDNFSETNEPQPLYINITLYDTENNVIPIKAQKDQDLLSVVDSYVDGENDNTNNFYIVEEQVDQKGNLIGCIISRNKNDNTSNFGGILKCKVNQNINFSDTNEAQNKNIELISYMPIPYAKTENYYIEGPSMILYDSSGGNPQYYKKPYKLYDKLTNQEIENIEWSIEHNNNNNDTKFLPELDSDNNLKVNPIYIESNTYSTVIAKQNDVVLWAQPLLILQNSYASPVLNKWDGRLQIGEDENRDTILSLMMGAGRKNENNKFDGVLMGDILAGSGDSAIQKIGLYGYQDGQQSFGFKIDGTAFIGKSGYGQIVFDGTKAIIKSKDENGMSIDLNDGIIQATQFSLQTNNILLQNIDNTLPYFKIIDNQGKILMNIDPGVQTSTYNLRSVVKGRNPSYYLASAENAMTIDLAKGSISAKKFQLTTNTIYLSDNSIKKTILEDQPNTSYVFSINNKFGITNSGVLHAIDVNLKGNITATNGKIGSWLLQGNKLYVPHDDSEGQEYGTGLAAPSFASDPVIWSGYSGLGEQPWDHAKILKEQGKTQSEIEADPWWKHTNFSVDKTGLLRAKKGSFGVWSIGADTNLLSDSFSDEASIYINSNRKPSAFYGTENQGSAIGVYLSSQGIHVKPLWLLDTNYADDWASWSAIVRVAGSFCKACQLYTGQFKDYDSFDYSFYDQNDIMNTTNVGNFAPTGWITYKTDNSHESLLFVNGILASIYKGEVDKEMTDGYYLGYTWMADAYPLNFG